MSAKKQTGVVMKVYTRHLGQAGVDEVEVQAPMGVVFKVDGSEFEVSAGAEGGIELRLTSMRSGATALVIEPRAANSVNVKTRGT